MPRHRFSLTLQDETRNILYNIINPNDIPTIMSERKEIVRQLIDKVNSDPKCSEWKHLLTRKNALKLVKPPSSKTSMKSDMLRDKENEDEDEEEEEEDDEEEDVPVVVMKEPVVVKSTPAASSSSSSSSTTTTTTQPAPPPPVKKRNFEPGMQTRKRKSMNERMSTYIDRASKLVKIVDSYANERNLPSLYKSRPRTNDPRVTEERAEEAIKLLEKYQLQRQRDNLCTEAGAEALGSCSIYSNVYSRVTQHNGGANEDSVTAKIVKRICSAYHIVE